MSYEKFVMDLDNCGSMLHMFQGMAVDEESLSKASYLETAPGENFLSTAHTMRHYATANYESLLPDTGPFETWQEQGSPSAAQRAQIACKSMLDGYTPPEMEHSLSETIDYYISEKKNSMTDEWY